MNNQLVVGFDLPQNSSSNSESINLWSDYPRFLDFQNAGLCRNQPVEGYFASNMNRLSDRSLLSRYKQPRLNRDFTLQLRALQQHYTILDDDSAIREFFAIEPELDSLLIEAVEPLRHAFGDKRLIYARIESSDEDSLLKVTVRLPTNFGDKPEAALQTFDEEWWLHNCHRSGGALVFDYEMQDAI